MFRKGGSKGVLNPPLKTHTDIQAHTRSMLRAVHSLMESEAAHLSFTHHWPFVSERDGGAGVRARMPAYTLDMLFFPLRAHDFSCTYTEALVCPWQRVCASKVCLRSCSDRYISVCMNAWVIVRACPCALLCMQLLCTAACYLGSAVTWPLLRNTRGSGSAEENHHISHSLDFLNFSTCT